MEDRMPNFQGQQIFIWYQEPSCSSQVVTICFSCSWENSSLKWVWHYPVYLWIYDLMWQEYFCKYGIWMQPMYSLESLNDCGQRDTWERARQNAFSGSDILVGMSPLSNTGETLNLNISPKWWNKTQQSPSQWIFNHSLVRLGQNFQYSAIKIANMCYLKLQVSSWQQQKTHSL